MKIDISSLNTALNGANGLPVRAEAEKSTPAPASTASNVSLSEAASKIQALEEGARQSSGFDVARVAALKQAIAEGKFQVSPQMIAEKLLDSARNLLQEQVA